METLLGILVIILIFVVIIVLLPELFKGILLILGIPFIVLAGFAGALSGLYLLIKRKIKELWKKKRKKAF